MLCGQKTITDSLSDLGDMPKLVVMDLSNNRLSGTVPDISNFTALQVLMLDNNKFTQLADSFLANADYVSNIRLLNLSRNQLSGQIPSEFGRNRLYSKTFELDFSQNLLTGSIPANLTGQSIRCKYYTQLLAQ